MTFGTPSEISIKKAKYVSKSFKLTDGGSMYLLVDTSVKHWWAGCRHAGEGNTCAKGSNGK